MFCFETAAESKETRSVSRNFKAPFTLPSKTEEKPRFYLPTSGHSETVCTCMPWQPMFAQPAAQYLLFRNRVEMNNVALENISVDWNNSDYLQLHGTVKVKNVHFEKQVLVRITTDDWRTQSDHVASYNSRLSQCDFRFDSFEFRVLLHSSQLREKIQLAICYRTGSGSEFWDNNEGCNFVIKQSTNRKHLPHCMAKVYNQVIPTYTSSNFESFPSVWHDFNREPIYFR
ncbi:Protein phosphatase 1 regulatory subunit 3B [Cichlidogyrus casuarinus]|uniref:Protein phosphatase 1 regulatory subunit 3B n=1 Tax=Cichlidogyrus casuarinus TaxID=1844966 RepID=A0ABD2PRU8_9PLAT